MDTETAFGEVLRQIRQSKLLRKGKKVISQEALSFLSGLDRTTVSQMERGKRNPSLKTLLMLSKALDVPADEIVREVLKLNPDVPIPEISSYLESSQPNIAKALRKIPYKELTTTGYKSICAGMASCGWMSHPLACLRIKGRSGAALKRALLETEAFKAYKAGKEPPAFATKNIELITLKYTDEHGKQEMPVLLNRKQGLIKKVDDGKVALLGDV